MVGRSTQLSGCSLLWPNRTKQPPGLLRDGLLQRLGFLKGRFKGLLAISFIGLLLLAASGIAQSGVADLRFLEIDADGDRTYHNAILSVGLGESRFSLESFWLFLPELDDYDEVGVGVGFRMFERGDLSISLLGYLASAPDDEYFEPALLVVDSGGRWTGSLFLLHYLPLGDEGIGQWLVDPLEIQYRIKGRVSIGVSAYLYRPDGGDWLRKIGPKVSLEDRLGATEIAVRDVNLGGEYEVQFRRLFFF